MSNINVTVTNAGVASVAVSGGSTVNATVGNGGAVNVSTGTISPGNATVVSGTLAINSVTTLAAGSQAYVKNDIGTAFAAKLDIGIPAGPATSVTVAKTTTLTAGSSATVTGVTDGGSLALSFGIPAGADGTNGTNGVTPTISATATTLSAGSDATVTATPSDGGSKVALAFGIPRGADGAAGSGGGAALSDSTPSALGTASAGVSTTASRSDHVHAVPVISYASLTNVPSTFAPSTHTHTASQVTDFTTAAAAAAPVQTVAGRTGDVVIGTTDVIGLADALANVNVDVIDGGDYVGVVVEPTPSITITAQPQGQSGQTTTSVAWDATQAVGSPATPDVVFYDGSSLWAGRFVSSGTATRLYKRSSGLWSANGVLANCRYMAQTSSALVTTDYSSRTVFRSTNGGENWLSSTRSSAFGVFTGLASSGSVVAGISVSASSNYGASAFNYGDAPLCTSTDNGATWSDVSVSLAGSGAGALMRGITYANGRFVAVGVKSDYVATATVYGSNYDLFATALTSTDGFSWNTVRMASSSAASAFSNASLFFSPLSVAYGGGKYIAVGASTGLDIPANSNTQSAGYAKPGYASANGTRSIMTSTDNGATWSTVANALPVSSVWSSIIYAAGQWVAFQASGNSYATSPDGVTWTARALPTSRSGLGLYGNATYDDDSVYVGGAQRIKITVSSSTVSATFAVSAYLASGTLTYQWQSSTDAGTTWANVSGATSATLSLSGLTTADNGKRYRCVLSATGVASVTTNSATLTVT
jgi:hypothetical protein